jgi:hypothetical protein
MAFGGRPAVCEVLRIPARFGKDSRHLMLTPFGAFLFRLSGVSKLLRIGDEYCEK